MRDEIPLQSKRSIDEEAEAQCSYFKNLWKQGKPLAKLFRTAAHGYLYDTGTNKVFQCEEPVFALLEQFFSRDTDEAIHSFLEAHGRQAFLDAVEKIKEVVEKEHVLSVSKVTGFGLSDHYGDINDLIASSLWVLTLEVTENCNLRCGYCVYNPQVTYMRNHGVRDMSLDVAYRAIDYLNNHSSKRERVAVTFYGGEPLLRFPFIRSCVRYARSVIKGRTVDFNITTNATLVTPEIIDFFVRNDFIVNVSLDGPQEIHDRYRKDAHGRGSYERVVDSLKRLVDAYGEKANKKVMLSMVYAPPFSGEKIDRITELWDELPWLPKVMTVSLSYPLEGSVVWEEHAKDELTEDRPLIEWSAEKFVDLHDGKEMTNPLARNTQERGLAQFMQRPIFQQPNEKYFLNGCCVPAVRKLYVAVDGSFRVCERISGRSPGIGSVFTGCNIDAIKKFYVDEYEQASLPSCSRCWAARLCHICYIRAIDSDGKFNIKKKEQACWGERYAKHNLLQLFCTLMEQDPQGLNYLYDYKVE